MGIHKPKGRLLQKGKQTMISVANAKGELLILAFQLFEVYDNCIQLLFHIRIHLRLELLIP